MTVRRMAAIQSSCARFLWCRFSSASSRGAVVIRRSEEVLCTESSHDAMAGATLQSPPVSGFKSLKEHLAGTGPGRSKAPRFGQAQGLCRVEKT